MILGALKSVLFAALAVLLSAGHSVCANMMAETQPLSAHQQVASSGHGDHADTHDSHERRSQDTAPCGPDNEDCQHCNAAQFYKTSVKAESIAFSSTPELEKAVNAFAVKVAENSPTNRVFRTAPPLRSPPDTTLVELKILLLI